MLDQFCVCFRFLIGSLILTSERMCAVYMNAKPACLEILYSKINSHNA